RLVVATVRELKIGWLVTPVSAAFATIAVPPAAAAVKTPSAAVAIVPETPFTRALVTKTELTEELAGVMMEQTAASPVAFTETPRPTASSRLSFVPIPSELAEGDTLTGAVTATVLTLDVVAGPGFTEGMGGYSLAGDADAERTVQAGRPV